MEKKSYKTIKWILKENIKKGVKNLWTWEKGKNENFTCIYKNYNTTYQFTRHYNYQNYQKMIAKIAAIILFLAIVWVCAITTIERRIERKQLNDNLKKFKDGKRNT